MGSDERREPTSAKTGLGGISLPQSACVAGLIAGVVAACSSVGVGDRLRASGRARTDVTAAIAGGSAWRAAKPRWEDGGRRCPRGNVTFYFRIWHAAPREPTVGSVVPPGVVAARVCLYSGGYPPSARNGGPLIASGSYATGQLPALLSHVGALPAQGVQFCPADGGGASDGLILINAKGQTFPLLFEPSKRGRSRKCGVVRTPAGNRVVGRSLAYNRALFAALGRQFPTPKAR